MGASLHASCCCFCCCCCACCCCCCCCRRSCFLWFSVVTGVVVVAFVVAVLAWVGVVAVRAACRVLLGCVSVRAVSFGAVSALPVFRVGLLLLLSLRQLVGFQCVQSWLFRLFSFPRRCCGCCVPHRSLAPRDLDHCGLLLAAASFKSHCSLCWNRLTELASTVLWLSELYTRTCPSKERLSSSVWLPCK